MNALMYHDVVPEGAEDTSGFPGRDAALYKVTPGQFAAHMDAIQKSVAGAAPSGFVATFDDGGVAAMTAADALERRGFRGDFFVTANYIGTGVFDTDGAASWQAAVIGSAPLVLAPLGWHTALASSSGMGG